MGDYSNSSYSGPFSDNPLKDEEPSKPTQPCSVCGEPTVHGADVDQGDGFKRVPVCDTGCLSELMEQMGGSAGSQVRSRYPSVEDQV